MDNRQGHGAVGQTRSVGNKFSDPTPLGLVQGTSRLVAQRLKHACYCVPPANPEPYKYIGQLTFAMLWDTAQYGPARR
jgi:hypothetical protein